MIMKVIPPMLLEKNFPKDSEIEWPLFPVMEPDKKKLVFGGIYYYRISKRIRILKVHSLFLGEPVGRYLLLNGGWSATSIVIYSNILSTDTIRKYRLPFLIGDQTWADNISAHQTLEMYAKI